MLRRVVYRGVIRSKTLPIIFSKKSPLNMPDEQLIMHKITKIAGRNKIFIFPTKNYYNMKNYFQLNPIIADFKGIDNILLI